MDIYYVEDLGIDEMIILKRVFKKWDGIIERTAVAQN
jgi:hypothetical protein